MEELDVQVEHEVSKNESTVFELVVLNDEINTFDHVILSLITICGLNKDFAIQCTYQIHHEGEATILEGNRDELDPLRDALNAVGLDAIVRKKNED